MAAGILVKRAWGWQSCQASESHRGSGKWEVAMEREVSRKETRSKDGERRRREIIRWEARKEAKDPQGGKRKAAAETARGPVSIGQRQVSDDALAGRGHG